LLPADRRQIDATISDVENEVATPARVGRPASTMTADSIHPEDASGPTHVQAGNREPIHG
jgi:hypothetical protein